MDVMQATDPMSTLSYEQARDEFVKVVGELERGSVSLEESLSLWERGDALAKHCEEWLVGAKTRLDSARAAAETTRAETAPSGTGGASDPLGVA